MMLFYPAPCIRLHFDYKRVKKISQNTERGVDEDYNKDGFSLYACCHGYYIFV